MAAALSLLLAVSFPSHAWALIDVILKPASRFLPQGRVVRWSWHAPGRVQFNVSSQEKVLLDFYVVSGHPRDVEARHWINEVEPTCKQCADFQLSQQLPVENETLLIVSNKAGPDTLLELQEALFGVESCMEQCFLKPTDFVGAGVAAASLLTSGFLLSRSLARDEREGTELEAPPWDEAWAPQLLQCKRPPKPAESWRTWILHACIMTYPWNPWCNDPLTFGCRCLVLVVSWGLTLFVSSLYGDIFGEWDSSTSTLTSGSSLAVGDGDARPSMSGAMLISTLSLMMENVLRILALSIFRCSLAVSRVQRRRGIKASALALAVSVVAACVIYPLMVVLSKHRCGYVQHLFSQFLASEAIRGLPLATFVASIQYGLLKALGGRTPQNELALSELSFEAS